MAYALLAYGLIAAASLAAGLASAPRPRSTIIVTAAALLWPVTMSAVVVHALMLTHVGEKAPATDVRAAASHTGAMPGWPAL